MKKSSLILVLASASLTFAAQGPANRNSTPASVAGNQPVVQTNANAASCPTAADSTAPITLSAAAQSALLFQIEEERMARELYVAFGAKWGLRPFQNIPHAEARHEEMLTQLAGRAGLTAPAGSPGRFTSEEIQRRHDALLALGQESANSALRAAAFVEEQDITDLRSLAAQSKDADYRTLLVSLETASGQHLGAFVRQLAARGVTYVPQLLTAADIAALGHNAPGRGGRGYQGGR